MEYTLEEKYKLISEEILKQTSKNPIEIVKCLMHKDYISIHGPEHHFLDGASFMIAYRNASENIDIEKGLETLKERTIKMPGAMCGKWGVCGSASAIGATLSIIHEVGPLSDTPYYSDDMEYTSSVLNKMSKIGGPRCCKRNAFLSVSTAVEFVKKKYGVEMELNEVKCEFSNLNNQCLKNKCPFFINNNIDRK